MTSVKYIISLFLVLGLLSGCKTTYSVQNITCEQIPIDATLDMSLNPQLQQFIQQYKNQIDSVMNQQIGVAAQTLAAGKPQSLLANFTADILRQAGAEYTNDPMSLALMNNRGLRSPINKGPITVGDIYKVFPFENELVVLKMKGSDINELFRRLAAIGGEGLSGCKFEIKDNRIFSLLVDGKTVDSEQTYWLATIDYLADGNSGMSILQQAQQRINTGVLLRDVMMEYIQRLTAQHKEITSQYDDRIRVLP